MAISKFYLCLAAFNILVPINCFAKTCIPKSHTALFVFGDSLFDIGNNNYINTTSDVQANIFPYGQTFFNYPSGRITDGRTIPDFIGNLQIRLLELQFFNPS